MCIRKGRTIGLIFFLFIGLTSNAQQQDTIINELTEVIITATRKAENNLNLPYSSHNITKKQIKEQLPRSMPEALFGIPGVFVQKTNHGGGSPFIRGLTGNQTLTLIDGVRLNNSTFRYGPNQYLNTIDLFTIDKIEVLKGSGSVQYGTDALGGVIQVFTKEPQFKDRTQVQGAVLGKYMTGDMETTARAEVELGSQKFAVMAGYSYKKFGDLWGEIQLEYKLLQVIMSMRLILRLKRTSRKTGC